MAEGTLTTSAVGQVRERAEHAKLSVSVREEGHTVADARDAARNRSAAIVDALVTSGVDEASIRRANAHAQENRDVFDEPLEYEYESTEQLVVRCGLDQADDALVAAIDAGGRAEYVEYGFSEERRERLKTRAIEDALEKNRGRAETIARTVDAELGAVKSVSTGEPKSTDGMQNIVEEAIGYDTRTELDPGPLIVDVEVEVCYRLDATADD